MRINCYVVTMGQTDGRANT